MSYEEQLLALAENYDGTSPLGSDIAKRARAVAARRATGELSESEACHEYWVLHEESIPLE